MIAVMLAAINKMVENFFLNWCPGRCMFLSRWYNFLSAEFICRFQASLSFLQILLNIQKKG
ncbi:unnamed protein product [Meloidogyne enterolobii]|uniref:Uncharacterized protein n=1 Tax=Meloidogyne enterolobii TaxID=390850 RepID=A0ACB0XYF1_MELEN